MRSSGTPAARAASYEHSSTAAPWSTSMLAHMRFGYGKHTMRLSGETVRISSGVYARARPRVRVARPRPPRTATTARSRAAGARRRRAPSCGAQRGLEQRVHHASARPPSAPSRSRSRPGRSSPITQLARRVVAGLPRELDARLAPRPPAGVHRSRRRRSSTTSSSPRWMRPPSSLTSSCGLLPPTVETRGRARRDAELAGEQRARVGIRPRPDRDDGDDVDAVEQRTGAPLSASASARRVGEQVDRRSGELGGERAGWSARRPR